MASSSASSSASPCELAGQIASAPNPRIALGDANGDGLVDICMLHGATKSIPDGGGVQVFLNSDDAWTER